MSRSRGGFSSMARQSSLGAARVSIVSIHGETSSVGTRTPRWWRGRWVWTRRSGGAPAVRSNYRRNRRPCRRLRQERR
uniref:Uncharacterized protein n=1 Tax=Oryza sativa subsp. japonica TaxID=39947 RepID=Q8H592_ORYSJ|nr:hypothetical protein [Oryza sativa Japonica Group]BAD30785.1 hypothetical protein [Oryza sativa Japonica Group]